jgi:predicted transglutaminase-like cysteine proteinase
MRRSSQVVAVAVALLGIALLSQAQAAFYGLPRTLKSQLDRIDLDQPALQPMAHTLFCLRYEKECKSTRVIFRPKTIALTEARWNELMSVNRDVNRAIVARPYPAGILRDTWTLKPEFGDCNDYAVTKLHQLLALGWPARALLLAVVRTSWGEGHLILVARTREGDLILDNLSPAVRPWSQPRYEWIQVQSPSNPKFWSTVRHKSPKAPKVLAVVKPSSGSRSEPEPVLAQLP